MHVSPPRRNSKQLPVHLGLISRRGEATQAALHYYRHLLLFPLPARHASGSRAPPAMAPEPQRRAGCVAAFHLERFLFEVAGGARQRSERKSGGALTCDGRSFSGLPFLSFSSTCCLTLTHTLTHGFSAKLMLPKPAEL